MPKRLWRQPSGRYSWLKSCPQPVTLPLPQPDYEHFVGRKKELALLRKLLSPENRHFVITIDGIGGIGKSALALEIAYQYVHHAASLPVSERFDAIIWVTAKQSLLTSQGIIAHPQTLRTLDDIYSTMASTLEREAITRARRSEQDEIVHSILRQQRTLLIIDNLETVDDRRVMSFIRDLPTPTKAIITTRHRVDVAYPIRLVGMSHSEALELIADESQLKQITLTDEQATRLYKRTGGVPLAIVWSVAQMSVSHNIEATLTHLGQPTSDIARFCFDAALHLIRDKPAHQLLMALSLFATDASRDALGYVTELPILDRDEGLEELEKLSLLNKEEGRFSLLPLTRVYSEMALQKATELEERFRERWVAYYVRFLLNRKNNKYDSINDVKLDWRNILDVMDYCWNTKKLNEFVTLIEEMEFYFWITLQWESWDNYGILGITAATSIHKSLSAAEIYRMLGNLNDFRANFSQAKYFITKSIEIYNSLGNKKGLATALWRLASIEMQCHEYDKAKNSIQKSLAIAEKINNENLIIIIKCRYAEICMLESNYEYADILLKHVQKWHDKTEKYTWESIWLYNLLGKVSFLKHDYSAANQYFQQSMKMSQQVNALPETAVTKKFQAEFELRLGNIERAQTLAKEAYNIFSKLGMKWELGETQALLDQIAAESESRNVEPKASNLYSASP